MKNFIFLFYFIYSIIAQKEGIGLLSLDNFNDEIVETYLLLNQYKEKSHDNYYNKKDFNSQKKKFDTTEVILLKSHPIKTVKDLKKYTKKVEKFYGDLTSKSKYWYVVFDSGIFLDGSESVVVYKTKKSKFIYVYQDQRQHPYKINIKDTLNDLKLNIKYEFNLSLTYHYGNNEFLGGSSFLYIYFSIIVGAVLVGVFYLIIYISKEIID